MSAPQIVCPVCHTRQPNAWDCVVCGGSLHDKPRHWQVPVVPLEGLETTALAEAADLPVERLEGLEITSLMEGEVGAPTTLEGLETTSFPEGPALGIDPAIEAIPDLEPTFHEADSLPTPVRSTVCRYCGTPWRDGSIFCGGCGVRVTTLARGEELGPEPATTTCRSCGTLGQVPSGICIGCGQKVPG